MWFGPPWNFTPTSTCSWIGHLVSGLRHATLFRPVQTRFPFGSRPSVLNLAAYCNSPVRSTKSTRSHLNRASSACKHRVSGSLSLPSRGAFHLSLTVLSAIAHQVVFSLGGWSLLLPTGFLVSRGTLDPRSVLKISSTGFLPSSIPLSKGVRLSLALPYRVRNPCPPKRSGLGFFPFARRYLGHRCFFLLLRLLRCFSSPGSLLIPYFVQVWVTGHDPRRVSPFGHPWFFACLPASHGFSQLATSFVGAWWLGIRPMLFLA